MVRYRRYKTGNPDDVIFITIVTHMRNAWIPDMNAFEIIAGEMERIKCENMAEFQALVILPNHIHWLLSPGKSDYSYLVSTFKMGVNFVFKKQGKIGQGMKLWQDRFWETTVRNDEHMEMFTEYIHYNPVKHGYVSRPVDWLYSSFHDYVRNGKYTKDWADGGKIFVEGAEYDL